MVRSGYVSQCVVGFGVDSFVTLGTTARQLVN